MIVEPDDLEIVFKVIVVGDSGCGKTSIVRQYVDRVFSAQYQASIGLHFAQKSIVLDDTKLVKLQLWDIAGQDRFREMAHVYYKNAVGGVVVCDVTRPKTVEGARVWRQDISSKLGDIPVMLLANKVDLLDQTHMKELSEVMDTFCKENAFFSWHYTSAKDDVNLSSAFTQLTRQLLKSQGGPAAAADDNIIVKPGTEEAAASSKCPC
eukprot:EC726355.1.p1 GENE.EC726355.1~~EC726355.1.p1  ORF type:complete len:208 (+),score=22.71 EC726355.1:74-697(+)